MIEGHDLFEGEMLQVLDEKGQVKSELEPALTVEQLKRMYALMMITRQADSKAFNLQRQGRMGTFAPSLGHEACQVGCAFPLRKSDWFFPYFRDLGVYVTLGLPLKNYYMYWMGNEEGMRIPEDLNIFTLAVPVASQLPHAVGVGMAAKMRNDSIAVLTTFSDGATSEGDFHEALNFAGVYKTPNIFVCFNNQYAISLPRAKQTASRTLAQKALAYGFEGVLVDGNDILAMYATTKKALEKVRAGKGPTLIEAYTYRMSDHTTSDDASKYRSKDEVEEWRRRDPLRRFRIYLKGKGIYDESFEKKVQEDAEEIVDEAVKSAESAHLPSIEDIFKYTYKEMTPPLKEQLEELRFYLKEKDK